MNIHSSLDYSHIYQLEKAFWASFCEKSEYYHGLDVFITKIEEPFLNLLMLTPEINEHHFKNHILEAESLFLKYQIPWTLWCNPSAKINQTLIEEYNFSLLETIPTLYFDVLNQEITDPLSSVVIKNVEIREAHDSADLNDWYEPIIEGFKIPDNNTDFLQLTIKKPYGPGQTFKHFIAYQNDNPLAAATLFLHDKYAMIHNIATKDAYKRKGLASAMILYALNQAKNDQCHYVILESSKDAVDLYHRLGFKQLYINQVYKQNIL